MSRNIAFMMLCTLGLMMPAQVFAGPRILCRETLYDFGEADNRGTVEHAFLLENIGDEDLQIGRARGCCGLTVDFTPIRLPPGSNALCRVLFPLVGRQGPQRKNVFVASNDPKQPFYELILTGMASPSVWIEPEILMLGPVSSRASFEREVSIRCRPGQSFAITNAVSTSAAIACAYRLADDGRWVVTARAVPPLPGGVLRGRLLLDTDSAECPRLEIPFQGMVDAAVVCAPVELTLPLPAPGAAPFVPMPFYLLVRAVDRKPFAIEKISTPDDTIRATVEPLRGDMARIRFDGLRPHPMLDGEDVLILLNHPEIKELRVPIKVLPAP